MDMENLFIEKPNAAQEKKPTKDQVATDKTEIFEKFLDLRKKLRRSIFRDDEVRVLLKKKKSVLKFKQYSHDAEVIMSEIEQFKGVTFDLVKVKKKKILT